DLRDLDLDLRRIDVRGGIFVMHDHGWEGDDQPDHDALDHHERDSTPINLAGGHWLHALARETVEISLARRHRSQVEQGKAERRVHERRLHVHAEDHAEPDEIDAEPFRRRAEQRNDDEGDFEEIEEEGEQENEYVDEDEETDLTAG